MHVKLTIEERLVDENQDVYTILQTQTRAFETGQWSTLSNLINRSIRADFIIASSFIKT